MEERNLGRSTDPTRRWLASEPLNCGGGLSESRANYAASRGSNPSGSPRACISCQDSISFWCDYEIYDVYSSHGYCCYGVAFFISFYTLRQGTSTDAKSNGFKWRSRTLKGSTGFSYGSTSGNPGVLGIPVEDIAATRIQTAFRAFMV
ncbi:hypothetical protein AAG906_011918 [Vitis piasezkii]